ncbi:MAG TPA: hypothetical protein VNR62_07935 [Cellulomonas sp.]|nr:hypothetical protein [Cellulomonas sp.]
MAAIDRVRAAAATVGDVARSVVDDHLAPVLADARQTASAVPGSPRPWPVLMARPYCLVRLEAQPADALASLAVAVAATGLHPAPHADGWGLTISRTARPRSDGMVELEWYVPGFDETIGVGATPSALVHVRAWADEQPGGCILRLDAEGREDGLARRVARALESFVQTWAARGVPVSIDPWRDDARPRR